MIVFENTDLVVKIISDSVTSKEAKEKLIHALPLSQEQVSAILKMKLKKIIHMEHEAIINEYLTLTSI